MKSVELHIVIVDLVPLREEHCIDCLQEDIHEEYMRKTNWAIPENEVIPGILQLISIDMTSIRK